MFGCGKVWEIPETVPASHLKVFRYTPYSDEVGEEVTMEVSVG